MSNVTQEFNQPRIQLSKKHSSIVSIAILFSFFIYLLVPSFNSIATPAIIADFGEIQYYALSITLFTVTGAIGKIISGKLSDLYGSKKIFIVAVILFLIGNLLLGISTSMFMLLIMKAISGIGSGFLMTSCYTLLSDLFVENERVKYIGYMASMVGISFIVGPVLGGYLVDALSWRWVYLSVLPLLIIAYLIISKYVPNPIINRKEKIVIDYLGIVIMSIFIISLLLALTWGGSKYAWGDPVMLLLYALTVIGFILFIIVEKKSVEPILQLEIFKDKNFIIPCVLIFSITFVSAVYLNYIPLYGQAVKGISASQSGLLLMPMMIIVIFSSQIVSFGLRKMGNYRIIAAFLLGWAAIMIYFVSSFNEQTNMLYIYLILGLLGISMGGFNLIFISYMQNKIRQDKIGVATGTYQFIQSIGATIGLSLAGVIMNTRWKMESYLSPELGSNLSDEHLTIMASTAALTNAEQRDNIKNSLPDHLQITFDQTIANMKNLLEGIFNSIYIMCIVVYVIAFIIAVVYMKNVKVTKKAESTAEVVADTVTN